MVSQPAALPQAFTNGPRPINLSRDMRGVLELLDKTFGATLDAEGRRMLHNGMAWANHTPGVLLRLTQGAGNLTPGFVWEEAGRIVGNVSLLTTAAPDRYLVANVAVQPSHRRRGIARILMQEAVQTIRRRNGRVISLQVDTDNNPAVRLYFSLGFITVGNMATWDLAPSRLHASPLAADTVTSENSAAIRELRGNEWRAAYFLDRAAVHPDLNWPEPLTVDGYRSDFWRRLSDALNGRYHETWGIADNDANLVGLATIRSEWGRPHQLHLRVAAQWRSQLERPLLAKLLRRLRYLPHRPIRLDHPTDDETVNTLAQTAGFRTIRTLTVMRLDLERKT